MSIERCNQVWSCDITYIRLQHGFVYLMAVMDWFSRYVLSWELSITLDTSFCLEAQNTAHIFTFFISEQFKKLRELASEIDQEYSTNDTGS